MIPLKLLHFAILPWLKKRKNAGKYLTWKLKNVIRYIFCTISNIFSYGRSHSKFQIMQFFSGDYISILLSSHLIRDLSMSSKASYVRCLYDGHFPGCRVYAELYCYVLGGHTERQWHPTPVLLPGKSYGRRSLVGYCPWGREELDTIERLHFHFSLSCTGEGNGSPLQYSCLENSRVGSLVGYHLWGHTELDTTDVIKQQQQQEVIYLIKVCKVLHNFAHGVGLLWFWLCFHSMK